MSDDRIVPDDPLGFIRRCVAERRLFWTYHVNMRMRGRSISRDVVVESVSTYEIIESYPQDKYLPSYLVWLRYGGTVFHAVFAVNVSGGDVRVVTVYRPDPQEWTGDFKQRRSP